MAKKGNVEHLFGWLGRQIGHVKKAVTTDVTKPAALPPEPAPQPQQQNQQQEVPPQPTVIYRDQMAEEVELPDRPGVKLRRTVIDEVIVDEKPKE